jgi:hypothetical protein
LNNLGEELLDTVFGYESALPKQEYIDKVAQTPEVKWLFSAKDFRNKVLSIIDPKK